MSLVAIIRDFDVLVRFHNVGFPAMLVLLGAVESDGPTPSGADIAAVLALAFLFNNFSYLSNDIIDLPVDRTQPRRANDPLVRGALSIPAAWAIVLAMPALSVVIVGFSSADASIWIALSIAYLGMTVYNIWGKKLRYPLITDTVEAFSWASIVYVGCAYVSAEANYVTFLVAMYGFLFIFLINGIHGGLRDLVNDADCGARTTAIMLGAYVDRSGEIKSSITIVVFSFAVHMAMTAVGVSAFLTYGVTEAHALWLVLFVATTLLSYATLWKAVRVNSADRDPSINFSLFLLLVILPIVFVPNMEAYETLLLVVYFVPLLAIDPSFRGLRRAIGSDVDERSSDA